MAKILIGGAGGAPSEGVIRSLQAAGGDTILGMGSEPSDLVLSAADRKFYIPYANAPEYRSQLLALLERERPDLIHFQNDLEIWHASLLRDDILATGTRLFLPPHEVIDTCVHKFKSWQAFQRAGVPVPRNLMINNEEDLRRAFAELGGADGKIWLRAASIGGGGKGSIPTADFTMAKAWIDHYHGWGDFVAAELLTPDTITWLSIWHEGELVVAQSRERRGWTHGNRSISGVTGVTKVGVTCDKPQATEIAIAACKAVAPRPHGIFGVDMTYNRQGVPNPTEINIARFFTTVRFFTEAGLNLPAIYKDLGLYGKRPQLTRTINPLPNDLLWLRGMDVEPRLMTAASMQAEIVFP